MYKTRLLSILVLVAILLSASVNSVWAVPPIPSSFYGEIHVQAGDSPPSAGDTVEAFVPGVTGAVATATITTHLTDLVYSIDVPGDDDDLPGKDGGEEGDTITFVINGRVVATGTWHSGTNTNLDFHPPQADPGGPYSGDEGSAINFTGSANDWGTDATTYEWDWDNDSTYDETGQNPSHTWSDDGTYTVGLKVTDAQGGEGTATVQVTVNNVAPVLTLSGAASVDEGSLYTLNLSAVTDPGADTISACTVDWGDGNSEDCLVAIGGSLTHTYADGPASPTISVDLTDEDGTYLDVDTLAVTVNNVAPVLTLSGDASVDEGSLYTLNLSAATDPGADTISACTVDWGDGNSEDCLGAIDGSLTHTYADGPDSPTISVDLTDEDGTYDDVDTLAVTVNNVAPVLTLSGDASVDEGSLYTLNLSAVTDPGADTISACTVDWGDGNSEDCLGAIGGSLTHTYADGPDSPTISVDLTDEDGTYDDVDTLAVMVNDVPPTNVDAGGPYNGIAGQPVALSGSATCVAVDTCTYAWDLDDDGDYDDATGQSASYAWNTVGDYTIGLQVTDDDGNAVTDTADVHISGATHSIGLEVGWNLVSFNLVPVDTAIATVLSSVDGNYDLVYAWDGQSQEWLKYDDIPLSPDTLTDLDETMGFWIHMTVADTLDVVGSVPTTTDISLYSTGEGWNLVGYPSAVNRDLPGVLQDHGVGTDFSLVYAYHANDSADPWKLFDRTAPDWANDLTELSPGWGYWIKVSADHTWSVDYLAP